MPSFFVTRGVVARSQGQSRAPVHQSWEQTYCAFSRQRVSLFLTCSWTNCEQGYAATQVLWLWLAIVPSRRVFLYSTWVHARKTRRTWSSTPCNRSWLLAPSRSS